MPITREALSPLPTVFSLAPPLSILVVGSDEWSVRAIESILSAEGYQVLCAGSGHEALDVTRRTAVAAVIAESTLSDLTGTELCRKLRADPALGALLPVVITMPGPVDRAARLLAHEAGAWQVCGQPLDVQLLVRQLDVYVSAVHSAHAAADGVLAPTGLYTPFGLSLRTQELGAEATRRRAPFAAVALSASVVGSHPSAVAAVPDQEVVAALADHLRSWRRSSDVVGHLSDEEFGIIAPSTGPAGAQRLVQRLADAVGATAWPVGRRQRLVLRAGIAATANLATSWVNAQRLLDEATAALRRTTPVPEQEISLFVADGAADA